MRITTKINLLTSAWVLCVLLVVNAVVFFSFMKITINTEEEELGARAQYILNELHENAAADITQSQLIPYLTNESYIRVIQPDNQIVEVSSDKHFSSKIQGKFSESPGTETHTIRQPEGEEQVLIVRVPIKMEGQTTGTLEIGERILGLELAKDILLTILAFCTVLGAVLSLLGGRWLSNVIMKPISNMINTMEDIEKSGIPKRIVIEHSTKDELQKMAETFNRMIGRLEANLDKQKQFISDASHELKTPLTVIKSYADLLRRRGVKNEELALDAIESIHTETTRIQIMTERLLDLAKTESEQVLEIKQIDLLFLCEKIINQLEGAYKREIYLHFKEPLIMVMADELKIKQVMIILLDNAIKYSAGKIDVFLEENNAFIIVRVKDYGIGIPLDEIENIFERFYRVDKARSRETGGTGLGLPIAKNIIKQHHGEIKVNSVEGKGTEVALFLPK
ncbi:histidine kinase [Bacillus sp. FJAT-27231]|uniref:sensor histidine kinase n=1 Tax=Bacillus sp. FJAT-27231 TaxID=1679168 RepID=UPI000671054F|nr:HAMP domain-containing sensor histidine kinase [Bacillus sp. FJAT-27231]KMY54123.1 histidine kinase [Bacillus sp. FJAT-27231]